MELTRDEISDSVRPTEAGADSDTMKSLFHDKLDPDLTALR